MYSTKSDRELGSFELLLWIVSLAFLSVGARNFENGLSIDGPLYATIARNIISTGEWFKLDSWVPDFAPAFAEHTHLGFWTLAFFAKVVGPWDWALRIPGHIFYVLFLFAFFRFIKSIVSEKTAVVSVIYLWTLPVFSNYFSNTYLDPGCLFYGFLSFYFLFKGATDFKRSDLLAGALSGLFLALVVLQKGLTVLGFGLPLAYASYFFLKNRGLLRTTLSYLALFLVFGLVLFWYYSSVQKSQDPDFFQRYFDRQFYNRFAQTTSVANLFSSRFWSRLVSDSHFISIAGLGWILIGLFFTKAKGWSHQIGIPFVFLASFILLYAPTQRIGLQYWMMIVPWIAWATGAALSKFIPWNPTSMVRFTGKLSLILVALIQYLPFRTHRTLENESAAAIRKFKALSLVNLQIIDDVPDLLHFVTGCTYAWYGNTPVEYSSLENPILPKPSPNTALILRKPEAFRIEAAKNAGWCLYESYPKETLMLHCSTAKH